MIPTGVNDLPEKTRNSLRALLECSNKEATDENMFALWLVLTDDLAIAKCAKELIGRGDEIRRNPAPAHGPARKTR